MFWWYWSRSTRIIVSVVALGGLFAGIFFGYPLVRNSATTSPVTIAPAPAVSTTVPIYPVTFPTDDSHNAFVVLSEVFTDLRGISRRLLLPAATADDLYLYVVYLDVVNLDDLVSLYRDQMLKFGSASTPVGSGGNYTMTVSGTASVGSYSAVLRFHIDGAVAVVSSVVQFTPATLTPGTTETSVVATSVTTIPAPETSALPPDEATTTLP